MTVRDLPAMPAISMRSGLGSEICPSALGRWQADIRAASDDTTENTISILGVIGADFFGDGVTARRVAGALRAIGDREVVVNINSPGGDFMEGLAIYNLLRDHKQKVTVKVLGMAASAASIISMAGDRIEVPRAGFLMIHNTWVMAVGDRNDLHDIADVLQSFDKASADVYAARSGIDAKDIAKMMDKETWLAGSDAVDKGFADAFLPADQVAKDAKASLELGASAAARRVELALAKAGLPQAERKRLISELKTGTRDVADDTTRDVGEAEMMRQAMNVLSHINP
ncbi:MAG: Clp protease ClpP [Mesorhizobium sp.]|nr:MAG: Clp protease ClpP [Mesorhizobium sp.]